MDLVGCGCAGFSYTDKYCVAMEELYGWILENCNDETYDYNVLQNLISQDISSDESEIRMLIPFMAKIGIINESCIIRGGSRIRRIKLSRDFLSENGKQFLQFLKIYNQRDNLPIPAKQKVREIFWKFGYLQFQKLYHCEEPVYRDMVHFLRTFESMDKYEFFIMTTLRSNRSMEKLDDYIWKYRNNQIEELKIKNHVNAYQYISKLLLNMGVIKIENSRIVLTDLYKGDCFNA